MKKFLIFIIILIPIIVTVALTATSRVISIVTPDNPFGIEIRDSDNKVIGRDDIINVDINDLDAFIIVDVLPLMTKNGSINPPEIEESAVGDVEITQRGDTNRYSVIPKRVGPVKVVLSAAANVNVKRAVIFNVTSESIESLVVFDEEGKELLSGQTIDISHSGQLYMEIMPIEALKDDIVSWRVSHGDSVSITPNGYLTINSRGVSEIRAMAKDKNGQLTHVTLVLDTKNAIVKDKKVYVEEENATSEYIKNVFTLDPANSVVTIEEDGEGTFVATVTHENPDTGLITEEVIQIIVTEGKDWGFIEGPSLLYVNNTPYFLGVKELLTGKLIERGVSFSADPKKAIIDEKTSSMIPLVPGELVVTAKKGFEEKQIKFTVKERVPTFELELGIEDAKLGIQLTRKWGHFWLDDEFNMTNQHRFGLLNKNNTYDVNWESSDSSVISIEKIEDSQDIMLTFHEEGAGKSSVISATFMLYNRAVEGIKRSFEFKLMDTPDYINVTKFEELRHMSFAEEYNACLQSDIIAPKQLNFNLGISFYGNGFLYDASPIPNFRISTGAINVFREEWEWNDKGLETLEGKVIDDHKRNEKAIHFEEMRMRNVESMSDVNMIERGDAITLWSIFSAPISFKYMQIYNTDRGIHTVWVMNMSFEGCILGDNGTYSVYAAYPDLNSSSLDGRRPSITLKNNVMKNSSGPGVFLAYGGNFSKEDMAIGYMPDVNIKGFLDIYNWHTDKSFSENLAKVGISALLEFTEASPSLIELMENMLGEAFYEYVTDKRLSHLYFVHNRTRYISLGIFAMGLIFNPDITRITSEDDRLTNLSMPILDENGQIMSQQLKGIASLLNVLAPGQFEVKYDSVLTCHDFSDGKIPVVIPGDPVPQTYELYAKLTGQSVDLYK